MRELLVISGKGGTGKTSLTAAFASLADNKILCDADVDAADLHLLMTPEIKETADFKGGSQAYIKREVCIQCGLCMEFCKFDAIGWEFVVDKLNCEGCGVCHYFCPEKAIELWEKTCGEWFVSSTRFGSMVHARLGIAEENSGKLVTLVRQEAKKIAEKKGLELIITDGPPGVGCPVIASLGGVTAVVVVTEPTVSGIHDMERVIRLAENFKVPVMVCINKYDLNPEQTESIIRTIEKKGITFLGKVPYDPAFTQAMVDGKTVLEYAPESDAGKAVVEIWNRILRSPEMNTITELILN